MWHCFKIIVITSDKNYQYVDNYFLIEHNYPHYVIYNFKPEFEKLEKL